MLLTLFLQNNAHRFQAVVPCLQKYHMTKDRFIFTICFGKSDVIKLSKALDVSKAHGYDGISVKMIKVCAHSVAHPLTLIFQNSLVAGIFVKDWKKTNIVPIYKKIINKLFQITDQFLFY